MTFGVKIFIGTGTILHAAGEAEMQCNHWLSTHQWRNMDGVPIWHTRGHFDATNESTGWGVYALHYIGPLDETPE